VIALEGIRPLEVLHTRVGFKGQGVVEVGNSGNVPGITGHAARAETGRVVDKVGNDHFDDLQGKQTNRVRVVEGIGIINVLNVEALSSGKGMVEVGNSGDVPGVTYQGAGAEAGHIMD